MSSNWRPLSPDELAFLQKMLDHYRSELTDRDDVRDARRQLDAFARVVAEDQARTPVELLVEGAVGSPSTIRLRTEDVREAAAEVARTHARPLDRVEHVEGVRYRVHLGPRTYVMDEDGRPVHPRTSPANASPKGPVYELEVTQGALNHQYLRVPRDLLAALPDDAVGGPRREEAGRPITLVLEGDSRAVTSDVDGTKGFFRERGAIGAFYRRRSIRAGDKVWFREVADRRYTVEVADRRS